MLYKVHSIAFRNERCYMKRRVVIYARVNVNIKMYKKWKIIMYIFSVILPLRMTQKALAYL